MANNKGNQETDSPHIYEEITQNPPKCSKTTNDESTKLKDEVVFDAVTPPGYRIIATSSHADNTITRSRANDYYIEEDYIVMKKDLENSEGNCQIEKDFKSNQVYSKLMHSDNQ